MTAFGEGMAALRERGGRSKTPGAKAEAPDAVGTDDGQNEKRWDVSWSMTIKTQG